MPQTLISAGVRRYDRESNVVPEKESRLTPKQKMCTDGELFSPLPIHCQHFYFQQGAVSAYPQSHFATGAASLCHTNLLVTVTSSVFADQCFRTILNLAEE